ncbi:efflux RND transporter permease subunit [Leucobacter chironomi]|uniref:efflux RND transporter permease subunit n=1 Tax=Leucobacter chironomi TaxID=491918 RepID=UPI000425BF92|nr:efflux RND transporter permease subunit [Leucobacter chironomi]
MHLLTALSLKNRALIALVTIVAAVFGLIGVGSLKQELMPSVQFPAIAVVTTYPGASPEVVNNDVSGPIETALRGVPQLETSTATSSTGASMVVAQFTYGVDLTATEQKVERAISRISQLLPEAADTQVMSGSIDDFPVIQIAVTPTGGQTPEEAAQLIERVAIPELSDIDGVRDAQLTGAREERIAIAPYAGALAENGLTSQAISDALQQSGVLMAAGTVTEGDRTLAVQAGTSLGSVEDIAAIPLPGTGGFDAATEQSTPLTIGDVAEVRLEPAPEQSISRINGEPALTIAVTKMSAANTVDVSHAVQQQLDELQDQLGGVQLTVVFDQAPYVEQSIHTLTTEGLLGLVFAVLVILVFLMSVRATLVTAISIPTSVLLTFVGLNFAEYTLNMLTLGALTISIGRVVDDSIVVIENIKRHLVPGTDKAKTIIEAVREVAGAITASTVTTVAVFLPMAFVDGMVGELFRPFAFTVTIALAASLLVSLTIVPVLAYWFLRPDRRRRTAGSPASRDPEPAAEPLTALQRWYRPVIDWTLKRPAATLLTAVLVFGLTVALSPLMKTNFMGDDEQNSIGLVQTLAPGTSLDAQLVQAERVEGALAELADIETVQVTIGSSGSGMSAIFGGGGDGSVSYSITTDADADQAQAQDDILAAVDGLDEAGEFSLGQSGGGVTTSSAIEVNVSAPDQETLAQASDAVLAELEQRPGLRQVESDLGASRPFLRVAVDRSSAAAVGLTEAAVAGQVAQQMQPRPVGQITMDADSVSIYLVEGVAPADQAGVAALPIMTAVGPQRLDALATIEVADGPVTVRTEDGVRMVTVSALPEGDDLNVASAAVNAALEAVDLPAGATASIGGVMSQQAEAFEQLGLALLAAILIVYVVMVATFRSLLQPLLLLVSVPFAATGAILLLIATGIPLGVASLIGVLMLVGIVVTNAIVLIDLVNQYRERGDALLDAVEHGALQRLRPIVMTALATILALTPMALGITGKGGFISQPLAVVVIGGLLSSTVLTLIVLPTLYYAVERRREGRPGRGPKRRGPKRTPSAGAAAPVPAAPMPAASDALAFAGAVGSVGTVGVLGAEATREATTGYPAESPDDLIELFSDPEAESGPAPDAAVAVEETPVEGLPDADGHADADASAPSAPEVEQLEVPEPVPAPVPAPAQADAETQRAILSELMRVGLSAPELTERGSAAAERETAEPEVDHAAGAADAADMGPATAQMSLALSDLGFTGDDNPLETGDEPADDAAPEVEVAEIETGPEADAAPADDLDPGEQIVPRHAGADAIAAEHADDSAAPAETPLVLPGAPAESPDGADASEPNRGGAAPAAPPVTGELDWEQLMWEATQEVEAAEQSAGADVEADAGRRAADVPDQTGAADEQPDDESGR